MNKKRGRYKMCEPETKKLKSWAENEIDLAIARERLNAKTSTDSELKFNYAEACYKSALKAYNSIVEDGHSHMSRNLTKIILNQLLDYEPLTPIEDVEDVWFEIHKGDNGSVYQCKRLADLFKYTYDDKPAVYKEVDRIDCYLNINDHIVSMPKMVYDTINSIYPIFMPYIPHKIQAVISTFELEGLRYLAIHTIRDGDKIVNINKFLVIDKDPNSFTEITYKEFENNFKKSSDAKY